MPLRFELRRGLRTALLAGALLLAPPAVQAASAYVNPFARNAPYVGRTDMGVDACLSPGDPIAAVGDGVVVGIENDWFQGQPYLWYRLTAGPDAGRYVYVAEQIHRLARPGQPLRAGEPVARYANQGTCIEMGWSAADGRTLAQATTGYTEGEVTPAGVSFARFLMSIGVPGQFELSAPAPAHSSRAHHHRRRRRHGHPARA